MATRIQLRRDTSGNWASVNPTLAAGEFGFENDTSKAKIGDGSTAWNALNYVIIPGITNAISNIHEDLSPELAAALAANNQNITAVNNYTGNDVTANTFTSNGQFSMGGHILPTTNAAFDIGNADFKVRHMYLSDSSLKFGDSNHSVGIVSGHLAFNGEQLLDSSELATVSTTGSYNDLSNKPADTTQADLDVDHLVTLSGVATASDHLGTFTGSTITDNSTVKTALQELELKAEAAEETSAILGNTDNINDLNTAVGTGVGWQHIQTFTGSTISDNGTVKAGMQELETAVELRATTASLHAVATSGAYGALSGTPTIPTAASLAVDDLITLSGASEGDTNLGTFTGSTIPDNQTIKASLQALETKAEGADDVVEDTSPQLGGDLDTNGHKILSTSDADIVIEADGTGRLKANSDFVVTADATVGGNMTIDGNLLVNGSNTIVNATVMTVDDPILTLGGDTAPSSDDNKDRGVELRWHDGTDAKIGFMGYDDSEAKFVLIADGTNTSEVYSGDHAPLAVGSLVANGAVSATSMKIGGTTIKTVATSGSFADLSNTPTQATYDIDHLVTLSGVATAADDLGTFSGSTIADTQTIKQALQSLETAAEALDGEKDDLITLSGVVQGDGTPSVHLSTFTGSTISNNTTVKAGMQELETAVETKLASADHTQASLDVDHLVTLTGVSTASDSLGSFSGSTIANNETIKGALTDLEGAVESKLDSSAHTQASLDVDHLVTLTGVATASDDLGSFSGSTIADSSTIKASLQALETAVEAAEESQADLEIDHLITLTGMSTSAEHLSTFTGSTISDNSTIKVALQSLETALEAAEETAAINSVYTGVLGVSAGDADLGTFTGTTIADGKDLKEALQALETSLELKLNSADHTTASLDIDHLITLSGVANASDHLGTFSGSTISDNVTVKAALQALESAVESAEETSAINTVYTGALGLSAGDAHYGTFTGSTITDNGDSKEIMQELETALELKLNSSGAQAALHVDHIITLSGVAQGSENLGQFSGSTITDNSTVKTAIQELETAVEAAEETSAINTVYTGILGVSAGDANLGTFSGSTIADNNDIKEALQSLETAVEAAEETAAEFNVDHIITLTGVASASDDLGTFTGSTIADNETIKGALQDLVDKIALVEVTIPSNAVHANYTAASTLTGVVGDDDLGTFTGSTIADDETIKGALQDLETELETKTGATQASLHVDHIITLSGVAQASDDLGTFTGSTIADDETIKGALQDVETAVETKSPSSTPTFDGKVTITDATSHIQFSSWTSTERDNGSWSAGAVIFNSTTSKLQVYDGSNFVDLH